MNVGLMQLTNSNINLNGISTKSLNKATVSNKTETNSKKFNEVFNTTLSSSSTKETTNESKSSQSVDIKKVEELLNSDSIEQVLDQLNIPHDEGLLMLQVSEEGQAIAVDELMDLDSLLAILQVDGEQLLDSLKQLTESDSLEGSDLWGIIQKVLDNAPALIEQITTALAGENKVTPKEAEQLLQFLKLVQTAGSKSDLLYNQANTLDQLKEVMQTIAKEINKSQTVVNKLPLPGFEQVVKQVKTVTENVDSSQNVGQTQQTTTTVKTVSINLPTEKATQPEALTKEIENVLKRSQFSNSQGTMKILLKLYPENLGSIRIELLQKDGVLTARMLTSTSQAKELLDSQIQQLKSAFAQSGVQMDRIDIAQSLQETDRNKDQQSFGNLFKQQKNDQEEKEDNDQENSDELTFSDYLLSEVLE